MTFDSRTQAGKMKCKQIEAPEFCHDTTRLPHARPLRRNPFEWTSYRSLPPCLFSWRGESAEALLSRFPSLSLELVNKVIAFYGANKDEVDAYVKQCQAEIGGQRNGAGRANSGGTEAKAESHGAGILPMISPHGFLLDEHLRGPLWEAIQAHNSRPEVEAIRRTVSATGLPRRWAPMIPISCSGLNEEAPLVSCDRQTMASFFWEHINAGRHLPGLILLPDVFSIPEVVEFLVLTIHAREPDEWRDRIVYYSNDQNFTSYGPSSTSRR